MSDYDDLFADSADEAQQPQHASDFQPPAQAQEHTQPAGAHQYQPPVQEQAPQTQQFQAQSDAGLTQAQRDFMASGGPSESSLVNNVFTPRKFAPSSAPANSEVDNTKRIFDPRVADFSDTDRAKEMYAKLGIEPPAKAH